MIRRLPRIIIPTDLGLPPDERLIRFGYQLIAKLAQHDVYLLDVAYVTWPDNYQECEQRRWFVRFKRFGDDEQIYFVPVLKQTILNGTAGSNQSWAVDASWDNSPNIVECIGAGGSGTSAGGSGTFTGVSGGGGGAYIKQSNIIVGNPTATYQLGLGGASVSGTGNNSSNAGGKTWFNAVAFPVSGSAVGADAGGGGNGVTTGTANGGVGGAIANNFPANTGFAGGRGGNITGAGAGVFGVSGAAGAGGPNGVGNQGVDAAANASGVATNGGSGDVGVGGTAGSGVLSSSAAVGGNGGNGSEFSANNGSGGGGGAAACSGASTATGGTGGQWGGGGSGAGVAPAGGSATSGAGANGVIALSWFPYNLPFTPQIWM